MKSSDGSILGVRTRMIWKLGVWLALWAWTCPAWADELVDKYILGYATALLKQDFDLEAEALQVERGIVTIHVNGLGLADRTRLREMIMAIDGVERVVILRRSSDADSPIQAHALRDGGARPGKFLPPDHLFQPLMADTRSAHCSATFQRYLEDDELINVGAISLGTTIPIYESDFFGDAGRYAVGVEGAVYSIFDLDAPSSDLVNADYWGGIPISYRWHDFSALVRVYHQSSHLGDEYLLRNEVDRLNISYEATDLRLSYDLFGRTVRTYAGGGYVIREASDSLQPWSWQCGLELRSPKVFWGYLRPVAALDLQSREHNDWNLDSSIRAGVQLDSEKLRGRVVQITLEYFQGSSPNGQFFDRRIEYVGLGMHFFL